LQETMMIFEDIAKQLGFGLLNEGGDMGLDPKADLLALFEACCSPQAIAAPSSTWKGRGWLRAQRDGADPVSRAWQAVCDNLGQGYISSRRAKEVDWAHLLGVEMPVELDISPNGGSTVGLRFRSGNPRSDKMKVNSEIRRENAPTEKPSPDSPPVSPPPNNADPSSTNETSVVACWEASSSPDAPVFIDLETRSACNLKKVGGRLYAQHPTTEIMTVAALLGDRIIAWTPLLDRPLPPNELWPDGFNPALPVESFAGPDLPPPLVEAITSGRPLCAHNAWGFDSLVWKALRMPEPSRWIDTLPDARASGLPGELDRLGERLLGRGKDKEGARLVKKLSRPNNKGHFLPFTPERGKKVVRYNIADVLLLTRVFEVAHGHSEPEVVALDRVINERGIAFDRDLARALISLENKDAQEAARKIALLTKGKIKATDLRRTKWLLKWLKGHGARLDNLEKDTIHRFLEGSGAKTEVVVEVLNARLAASRITTSKAQTALTLADEDGRLRHTLIYHKAHTGRWSSRGVQLHNLPRPHESLKDLSPLLECIDDATRFMAQLPAGVSFADGLSALLRLAFFAARGYVLGIGDWASVEARCTAWCANEKSLLDQFAQGADTYCGFASLIFGCLITKANKRERAIGKEGVLGCGYSMGADTFGKRCAAKGIDLAAAGTSAEAVVESFRDAYPAISGQKVTVNGRTWREGGLWRDVEAAARAAIESAGGSYEAGRCFFYREGAALVIRLPSGRRLYYRNARLEERVPGYCKTLGLEELTKPTIVFDAPKICSEVTYGGKLVENICQAICRDLLVAALIECERQNLRPVLHVHDEIVTELRVDRAGEDARRLAVIMSTPPAWAQGFPVEVEVFTAERYLKGAPQGVSVVRARNGEIIGH
jgi:DNA polymerase